MKHSSIARRLRLEMDRLGLNSTELARQADLKPSFLYDVLSGKSANPSPIKLARVAEALNVNLASLIGLDDGTSSAAAAPAEFFVAPPLAAASGSNGKTATACAFRHAWVREQLKANPLDLRTAPMRGDGMEPTLRDGDILLVDVSETHPSPPGLFALHDGTGLSVKRLEMIHRGKTSLLRIISDNPLYPPCERRLNEMRILGRVVWFARTA